MRPLKITQTFTNRSSESFNTYLKEVSKIEAFKSPSDEAEVAMKAFKYRNIYEKCEDKEEGQVYMDQAEVAIEELVKRNLRFVNSVAKQYTKNGASLEDLVNEGNSGLLEAARRFDPTTGNKFISYAVWYVRKDILAFLSKNSRTIKLPTNKINLMTDFKNKVDQCKQKLQREVELEDLLGNIEGYSDKQIKDMVAIMESKVVSADAPTMFESDSSETLYNTIESKEFADTDHLVVGDSSKRVLENLLETLSPRDKHIMKLYYGLDGRIPMNLHEVGTELGLTREAIRQIKEKSLKKLRVASKRFGLETDMF
jgi:RNA polymerase primary sigma factor